MKPENQVLLLLVISIVVTTILAQRLVTSLIALRDYFRRRNIYPNIVKMEEKDACKLHDWNEVFLAMASMEPKRYKVCLDCGSIAGTKKKVNEPGLVVYKATVKARKERAEQFLELGRKRQVKLDLAMNRLIRDEFFNGSESIEALQNFFRKVVIEVDSINDELVENLDEFKR